MAHVVSEVLSTDTLRLAEIGRLRLDVWRAETTVDLAQFPRDAWIEPLDAKARHWIACDDGVLVAAARLTLHADLDENPDGYLWRRANIEVPTPAAHLCKLVVHRRARGMGIGRALNDVRIEAAREMGAKSILVTASDANARLLSSQGFTDTGIRETFSNRPGFPFRALQRIL